MDVKEMIYGETYFPPETEKMFEEVEKALGFKLFFWQKTYIAEGIFRRTGRTTAEILRDLLGFNVSPIDYSKKPRSRMEEFYRYELREIKSKLDAAGIKTRTVFWSEADKRKFYEHDGLRASTCEIDEIHDDPDCKAAAEKLFLLEKRLKAERE